MASGHRHEPGAGGHSAQVVLRLMKNPEFLDKLHRPYEYDHDHDLPYLGGYSKDGHTIYLDRHIPDLTSFTSDGYKHEVNLKKHIIDHETFEKACIDALGWSYEHAHQAATAYERRLVMRDGLPWAGYQRCAERFVKATEHEKLKKVPANLDMTPYYAPPVNKKLIAHMESAMDGKNNGKKSKSEVNYSEGMAKSHCGPCRKWPNGGDCRHFEAPHACECVRGYIEPAYWCKLWLKTL